MFYEFQTEEVNGKTFIKRIIFDTAEIADTYCEDIKGYEGKTFKQLMDEEEIKCYSTGLPVESADVIEFTRPISIDRFLLMFSGISKESLDYFIETDVSQGIFVEDDSKKYVY